ncbi:hypothetical protein [Parvicella tangerina]|uniref:Uncharacterized protein n=1 Tax=Parvicella tangerina TaxID=2829795 RepID=A0A916JM40_9FLAO|nr:hypothetical protein [Parvicella tangerina]CAG5079993.1 hypothetical protein CRYO30217_01144 [Parvicella tangerina]
MKLFVSLLFVAVLLFSCSKKKFEGVEEFVEYYYENQFSLTLEKYSDLYDLKFYELMGEAELEKGRQHTYSDLGEFESLVINDVHQNDKNYKESFSNQYKIQVNAKYEFGTSVDTLIINEYNEGDYRIQMLIMTTKSYPH